jgi:hypothetical protein
VSERLCTPLKVILFCILESSNVIVLPIHNRVKQEVEPASGEWDTNVPIRLMIAIIIVTANTPNDKFEYIKGEFFVLALV